MEWRDGATRRRRTIYRGLKPRNFPRKPDACFWLRDSTISPFLGFDADVMAIELLRRVQVLFALVTAFCVLFVGRSAVHGAQSQLRYSPGFFVQGNASQPAYPPRMGLVEGKTWQDVLTHMDEKRRDGVTTKLVVFLRHGEGTHNVAIDKYGSDAWNAYYCKLPEYLDAPLTTTGVNQAAEASARLKTEMERGLQLEQVLISPLERALRTFTIAYQNQTTNIITTPLELPREILGVDTCDERRNISDKRLQYPQLDFSDFESDSDPWWTPDHRETESEIDARASKFLDLIFHNITAQTVGVVSHSVFGAAILRAIGHRAYSLGTAEFLPLLIEEGAG